MIAGARKDSLRAIEKTGVLAVSIVAATHPDSGRNRHLQDSGAVMVFQPLARLGSRDHAAVAEVPKLAHTDD